MFISVKRILRTPVKAAAFFLLLSGVTLFLILSLEIYVESTARIEAVENEFKTIGYVTQKPEDTKAVSTKYESDDTVYTSFYKVYDDVISPDALDFEGADYIVKPENRTYYTAYLPDMNYYMPAAYYGIARYVVIFTVEKDCDLSAGYVEANIEEILYQYTDSNLYRAYPQEGEKFDIRAWTADPLLLTAGKRYVGRFDLGFKGASLVEGPVTTQYDTEGKPITDGVLPFAGAMFQNGDKTYYLSPGEASEYDPQAQIYVDEVTEGFFEGTPKGRAWLNYIEVLKNMQFHHYFDVLATNSLELLPSYHNREVMLSAGRAISQEEFESGASVCLISQDQANHSHLEVGDKVPLSLISAYHGGIKNEPMFWLNNPMYSLLDSNGDIYQPFWEEEYEVVGIYKLASYIPIQKEEFQWNMFIVPTKSVRQTAAFHTAHMGVMNRWTTSFQIKNGTIEEFDSNLRNRVPAANELEIIYDDSGYTNIMMEIRQTKKMAVILFAAGAAASLLIITLLLYFFVVKKKKRTAIERSLGMTKQQCRISLLGGILSLTTAAAATGSLLAALSYQCKLPFLIAGEESILNTMEFDLTFSIWAKYLIKSPIVEPSVPPFIFIAVPLILIGIVSLLTVLLIDRNLKSAPITLLGSKGE